MNDSFCQFWWELINLRFIRYPQRRALWLTWAFRHSSLGIQTWNAAGWRNCSYWWLWKSPSCTHVDVLFWRHHGIQPLKRWNRVEYCTAPSASSPPVVPVAPGPLSAFTSSNNIIKYFSQGICCLKSTRQDCQTNLLAMRLLFALQPFSPLFCSNTLLS